MTHNDSTSISYDHCSGITVERYVRSHELALKKCIKKGEHMNIGVAQRVAVTALDEN
jgi:hypothetical protein